MNNIKAIEIIRRYKNIDRIKIKNENSIYVTFKNKYISTTCCCYDEKEIAKRNHEFLKETYFEIQKINTKAKFKNEIKSFLQYKNTKRDYILVSELKMFLENHSEWLANITYQFDILGWLEDFKLTPKGISAIDGTRKLNTFNNHSNKDMKFYLDGLMICL